MLRPDDLVITVGVEQEGLVLDKSGRYVDLAELLRPYGGKRQVVGYGYITTDAGPWQVELVTVPSWKSGFLAGKNLSVLHEALCSFLPEGVRVAYVPYGDPSQVSYDALMAHPSVAPRVRAQLQAIAQECGHTEVANAALVCGVHVHVGVMDRSTRLQHCLTSGQYRPFGVFLRNFLNHIGPYHTTDRCKGEAYPGELRNMLYARFRAWHSIATPARAPQYAWSSYEGVKERARRSGKRLVRFDPNSAEHWHVDLATDSVLEDPIVAKTIWDYARLSFVHGTIETRIFPSTARELVERYVEDIYIAADAALTWWFAHQPSDCLEDAAGIFPEFHRRFPDIVPPDPLLERDWYGLLGLDVPERS